MICLCLKIISAVIKCIFCICPPIRSIMLKSDFFVSLLYQSSSQFSSVQFSHSVVSNSLWPHESQHARPPCPSPTPRVYPNLCPLSWLCHPTISSSCPLLLLPSIFPSIRVFSNESALRIRWPKYWSYRFNISPSNEHPGLIALGCTGWISL